MKKFANESAKGRARAQALNKPERMDRAEPHAYDARKVDPSVCLGPLEGEPCGSVPINSPAYTGKFK